MINPSLLSKCIRVIYLRICVKYSDIDLRITYTCTIYVDVVLSIVCFRMLILDGTFGGGTMLGSILSAHLLKAVGNVYLLLIVTAINVVAYVHTLLFVEESLAGAIRVFITFIT